MTTCAACQHYGLSRQAYYKQIQTLANDAQRVRSVIAWVRAQRMKQPKLLVVPKRSYHKTTNSHHHFRRHPNLLKPSAQQMTASGSEQIWVADITYIPTKKQTVYLSLITDAYSRKIVGHYVHARGSGGAGA